MATNQAKKAIKSTFPALLLLFVAFCCLFWVDFCFFAPKIGGMPLPPGEKDVFRFSDSVSDEELRSYNHGYSTRDKFKAWLSENRVTIKRLAERVGCSAQHLSGALSGRVNLCQDMIDRLNRAIACFEYDWEADYIQQENSKLVRITVTFNPYQWGYIKEALPEDLDLAETLKRYVIMELLPTLGPKGELLSKKAMIAGPFTKAPEDFNNSLLELVKKSWAGLYVKKIDEDEIPF